MQIKLTEDPWTLGVKYAKKEKKNYKSIILKTSQMTLLFLYFGVYVLVEATRQVMIPDAGGDRVLVVRAASARRV